jgi:hypothetical protein
MGFVCFTKLPTFLKLFYLIVSSLAIIRALLRNVWSSFNSFILHNRPLNLPYTTDVLILQPHELVR